LCQGVGSFAVQGWYDAEQRWIPEIDIDGDGKLVDGSDFPLVGGVIDPINLNGVWRSGLDEEEFNIIPGLGRAFKFTFTLYDSMGIFPEGKIFTHIVYLDN
jgi:hypothetical protein